MKFIKHCPECGREQKYKRELLLNRAIAKNTKCKSCSQKGNTHCLGNKHSEKTRKQMSLTRGGNGDIDKDKFNSTKLRQWANRAREKTPFCEWCYSEDCLEAHHIMPKAKFPQYAYDDSNVRVMCKSCHITCHKQGGF